MACGDSHVAMVCWVDLRDFDPGGSCTGATNSEDTLLPEDDRPAAGYNCCRRAAFAACSARQTFADLPRLVGIFPQSQNSTGTAVSLLRFDRGDVRVVTINLRDGDITERKLEDQVL